MVCCCLPCIRIAQSKVQEEKEKKCTLIITEIIRYICIGATIMLSVWRYADLVGYTEFIPDANCTRSGLPGHDKVSQHCKQQFWGIACAIFVGGTLILYVPLKLLFARTVLKEARYLFGWRPSMLTYIFICALPSFMLLLMGITRSDRWDDMKTLDSESFVVIQIAVMGLVLTEWMAKIREEIMTYDLVNAMATDFFFAYDVFDFFYMILHDEEMFHTYWIYVIFAFAWFAMFKYVPMPPTTITDPTSTKRAVTCILVSLFCNDLPFVIIRITTMVQYGLDIGDIIHPTKNIALILFGFTQLYIIWYNNRTKKAHDSIRRDKSYETQISERRCVRNSKLSDSGSCSCRSSVIEPVDVMEVQEYQQDDTVKRNGDLSGSHKKRELSKRTSRTGDNQAFDDDSDEQKSTKFV